MFSKFNVVLIALALLFMTACPNDVVVDDVDAAVEQTDAVAVEPDTQEVDTDAAPEADVTVVAPEADAE